MTDLAQLHAIAEEAASTGGRLLRERRVGRGGRAAGAGEQQRTTCPTPAPERFQVGHSEF